MPIKIPADLPATETLHKENIFVMTESRATTQDIRPLKILLLNLMPTKIARKRNLRVCSATLRFKLIWSFCKPLRTHPKTRLRNT